MVIALSRLGGILCTVSFVIALGARPALAGPPFVTDDPEPTEYQHWEIYTGVTYENDGAGNGDASVPFAEFNYGALPNVQVSLSAPVTGNGGLDVGIKTRFVEESEDRPQISFYPSIETAAPGSGAHAVTFLPVWLQKSRGPWTAFGGGGVYLNPGTDHRSETFLGGALERTISPGTTVGLELFHQSAASLSEPASTAANVGAIVQVGRYHALLFSVGRGLSGANRFSSYASYEYELGPSRR